MQPTPEANNSKIKPFKEALQIRFNEVCKAQNWSLRDLKTFLGVSEAAISKYRNGKPEGDVAALEARIEDFLHQHEMRSIDVPQDVALFETLVVKQTRNVCDLVKRHTMMGMIIGEPGIGKSSAVKLYKERDSLAICMELNTVTGGGTPSALVRNFFRQVSTSNFNRSEQTKGEWLIERFEGSGRLIVIDNAHLLSHNGLEWVLGFHDATACPVVLIGNSELKQTMRKVQRGPSRVGVTVECDLKKTLRDVASEYLKQHWPESAEELITLATAVLERPGRLRALRQVVRVARDWATHKHMDATTAFTAAMNKQVEDYKLAA